MTIGFVNDMHVLAIYCVVLMLMASPLSSEQFSVRVLVFSFCGALHMGRLFSFEVVSADLPTMLEEDRIASCNFSKAWLISLHNSPKEYCTSGNTTWTVPAHPVASLWGIFSKATRPGGAF